MPLTPKGVPFPDPIDPDKPRLDLQELAEFLDQQPGIRTVTTAQRNALTNLWPGLLIFNSTTQRIEVNRTGTAGDWVALFTNAAALPVENGGTGLAVAPSLLVNLASTAAASPLQEAPRPGVTGKLPVANGGTGLDAAPSLLVNLASAAAASPLAASPRPGVTGVLPVANGGTGGSNKSNARAGLGFRLGSATVGSGSSPQVVPLTGFTATPLVFLAPTSQFRAYVTARTSTSFTVVVANMEGTGTPPPDVTFGYLAIGD